MKNTKLAAYIAAAISCVLITPTANALPAEYTNNPENYRVAYASIAAHLAAGERDQVVDELERIGIRNVGGSDAIKFETGRMTLDRLLDGTGYTFDQLAPPAETAPMMTLTPATQPVTGPQDNGAAAATKAQLMQAAQTAGTAAGKDAPIPMMTLTPATQPAQLPPQGDAAATKAQLMQQAQQAGTQRGHEAEAADLQEKADEAKTFADHSRFITRVNVADRIAQVMRNQIGGDAGLLHDANGYYYMQQSDVDKENEARAVTRAAALQTVADQASTAAQPVTAPQGDAAATKAKLMTAAQTAGTAAGKAAAQPTTTTPAAQITAPQGDAHTAKAQLMQQAQTAGIAAGKAAQPQPTTTTAAQTTAPQGDAAATKAQLMQTAQAAGVAAGKAAAAKVAQPVTTTTAAVTTAAAQQPTTTTQPVQQSTTKPTTTTQPVITAPVQQIAPDYRAAIDANQQTASSAQRQASTNSAAIVKQGQQINRLNDNFRQLKDDVEDNRKESRAGIAGAISIANLPQVTESQKFGVSAAVGGYEDQNALAVGVSARPTDSTVVKAGVTTDTNGGFGYGVGAMVGW